MRLHIIIEDQGPEGLSMSPLASEAASPPVASIPPQEERPALPPKPRGKRLTQGHMKSAALGRKRARITRESIGPQEDFEDVAHAVSETVRGLPFTPQWKRKRAGP